MIPKKGLGQHFLINEDLMSKVVSYASLSRRDIVLEIGPGLGFLTEKIASQAKKVIAVEIDPEMACMLERRLINMENLKILMGDIFDVAPTTFRKVVSTPPYSISTRIILWLWNKEIECSVLVLQEELAQKLVACPGSKGYGRLSVNVHCRADVELLDRISKEMFWPSPKVDSRIVRLTPKKTPVHIANAEIFSQTLNVFFTQRNRKIKNILVPLFIDQGFPKTKAREISKDIPCSNSRPRQLMPEEIAIITNKIAEELREANHS